MKSKILLLVALWLPYAIAQEFAFSSTPGEGITFTNGDSSFSTTQTATSTSKPKFKCQGVGRSPYPGSCAKYYYCWDNVHHYAVFTCSKVFDPVSQHCVNNYALCHLAPTCTANKQLFPLPNDKTSFLECTLRLKKNSTTPVYELHKKKCEKDREFDAELGHCRLITMSEWTSSDSASHERFECNSVGKFIDFTSDSHYIQCVVGSVSRGTFKAIRRKCARYGVFSAVQGKCVPLL